MNERERKGASSHCCHAVMNPGKRLDRRIGPTGIQCRCATGVPSLNPSSRTFANVTPSLSPTSLPPNQDEVNNATGSSQVHSGSSPTVFVSVLMAGLLLAATIVGIYYFKCHRRTNGKGIKLTAYVISAFTNTLQTERKWQGDVNNCCLWSSGLCVDAFRGHGFGQHFAGRAEESYMADEENQGNTLVSVAPLNQPEPQEKPSLNGESQEAVKAQTPPAATNGHSTTKTADTEL
ncbi:putative RNA methyltransferase lmo1703 [Labeo rohita]|uniref:RNA methyltransferase lmo1703 n=1 Tax=Labeo rohita TaxID=84645 RepID=A0ABQ8LGB7_LABRO|nr:putative RNA methyltransferase lmo1703 [Labeo rohita]